jgi:hypothetical protein
MTAFLAAFSMREMKVVMKEVMKGVRECGSWLYTSPIHKCAGMVGGMKGLLNAEVLEMPSTQEETYR